jgi:hypothetical protein
MARKISHWTNYDLRGPGIDYTDPASGATDDWAYGTLGAAGMTWEVGDSFHQDCETFESDVLPKNTKALTYAAKLTHRPYSLAKGPDITSLELAFSAIEFNGELTLKVEASDSAYSDSRYNTASHEVNQIRIYVDQHPYRPETRFPQWVMTVDDLVDGKGELTWEWQVLSFVLKGEVKVGTHVIYLEAVDSEGTVGPVAAVSFQVQSGPTTSPSESALPSDSPSLVPSHRPSPTPTQTPSNVPSPTPTSSPSSIPTSQPSRVPTNPPTSTPRPTACADSDSPICSYVSGGRSHVFCDAVNIKTSCRLTCRWCFPN